MSTKKLSIAIIGAGPGGLCMGKRLLDKGFDNFVIIEQANDIGGVWLVNRYPGCACNTPSLLYSFSFETNPNWSTNYPTQPEILDYLQNFVEKYNLRPRCQFGHGVIRAKWSDTTSSWTLTLDSGDKIEADVVISAVGMFNTPRWPKIDGLDKFKGAMWHSAQWDSEHDLSKERVAVIGSGDSSVQIIPEIVKIASQVHIFQRTANYVMPKQDEPDSREQFQATLADPKMYNELRAKVEHNINTYVDRTSNPVYRARFETAALTALEAVKNPELRQKLRPSHPFSPRRSFFSNTYYPAFNEPNLELVTEPIKQFNEHSILTVDGRERSIDTIIITTGFEAPKFLSAIDVVGRGGQTIEKAWLNGPIAYLGIMTSDFPNLFMLFGPNTYTGSVPIMIEVQVDYILAHINRLANDGIASVDVKPAAMLRYDNVVQAAFNSIPEWKIDNIDKSRLWSGGNVKMWPFTIERYRWLTAKIDPEAFSTTRLRKK